MADIAREDSATAPRQTLADIRSAAARVEEARSIGANGDTETALQELQTAVDDARDLDVTWGAIGEVLGMTRGNAYQRYRRRPEH